MENKILLNNKTVRVPVVNSQLYQQPSNKEWITISGIATSQVRSKTTTDTPAYIFLRQNNNKHSQTECVSANCKRCEIPVIFRIKQAGEYFKPEIKKGDNLELAGIWADTHKPRPSFTAYNYQVL